MRVTHSKSMQKQGKSRHRDSQQLTYDGYDEDKAGAGHKLLDKCEVVTEAGGVGDNVRGQGDVALAGLQRTLQLADLGLQAQLRHVTHELVAPHLVRCLSHPPLQ
jgi:hypothetical protein